MLKVGYSNLEFLRLKSVEILNFMLKVGGNLEFQNKVGGNLELKIKSLVILNFTRKVGGNLELCLKSVIVILNLHLNSVEILNFMLKVGGNLEFQNKVRTFVPEVESFVGYTVHLFVANFFQQLKKR